jgi:L-ascorbate metabolism protein UlaG (beta-lactamase superfamily)
LKAAFQKEDALLADIADARRRGGTRLWWLGQSGFLLHAAGKTILFDPYLSDSLTRKYANTDKPHVRVTERVVGPERLTGVDCITCSHNHTDHLDAETLLPVLDTNPGAKLLIPRANLAFVLERLGPIESRLVQVDAGESVSVDGIEFHGVPSAHNTVERDEKGRCRFLGYVARVGQFRMYHSGDTLLHDGLVPALRLFAVDVACLPINGNRPERRVAGNLNGIEAAQLARQIRAKLAVPHHFDMFAFNTEPPDEFEAECRQIGQPFRTLQNGESVDLQGQPDYCQKVTWQTRAK